jgi:hypothetical protein
VTRANTRWGGGVCVCRYSLVCVCTNNQQGEL